MNNENRNDLGLKDAAGCACCSPASAPATTAGSTSVVTAEVLVSGMTCQHCVKSVTEELTALDGVDGVAVDLNAGGVSRVTILSSAPISADDVAAAVEEAGYTLAGSSS